VGTRVLTYVHTGLSYSEAVGATVTLAHRCPRDSVLDLTTTKRLQAATPPNYRLVRGTYDRLGAVSTWRMVQPRDHANVVFRALLELRDRTTHHDSRSAHVQWLLLPHYRTSVLARLVVRRPRSGPLGSDVLGRV
jgi:hypothetical protein